MANKFQIMTIRNLQRRLIALEEYFKKLTNTTVTPPNNGGGLAYEIYTAKITKSIIFFESGILEIGKEYVMYLNNGDDFSNVGYVSNATPFIATGTTPTNWTNNSYVVDVTASNVIEIMLEDTLTSEITYEFDPIIERFFIKSSLPIFGEDKTILNNSNLFSYIDANTVKIDSSDFTESLLEIKVYN